MNGRLGGVDCFPIPVAGFPRKQTGMGKIHKSLEGDLVEWVASSSLGFISLLASILVLTPTL